MVMVEALGGQVQRGMYGSVVQLRISTHVYLCSTGVPGLTAQWSGAGMQLNGASALGPWRQRAGISAKPVGPPSLQIQVTENCPVKMVVQVL